MIERWQEKNTGGAGDARNILKVKFDLFVTIFSVSGIHLPGERDTLSSFWRNFMMNYFQKKSRTCYTDAKFPSESIARV